MNVFIDCGAGGGTKIDLPEKCEIHSFEPNPALWEGVSGILHKEAAWIEDGEAEFYLGSKADGSTLTKGKITRGIDYEHPMRVKTIDLGKWIKDTFQKDDYIILKLDVEGAEETILRHMLEDGSIIYINRLLVEWHYRKFNTLKYEDAHRLMSLLLKRNILVEKWS